MYKIGDKITFSENFWNENRWWFNENNLKKDTIGIVKEILYNGNIRTHFAKHLRYMNFRPGDLKLSKESNHPLTKIFV